MNRLLEKSPKGFTRPEEPSIEEHEPRSDALLDAIKARIWVSMQRGVMNTHRYKSLEQIVPSNKVIKRIPGSQDMLEEDLDRTADLAEPAFEQDDFENDLLEDPVDLLLHTEDEEEEEEEEEEGDELLEVEDMDEDLFFSEGERPVDVEEQGLDEEDLFWEDLDVDVDVGEMLDQSQSTVSGGSTMGHDHWDESQHDLLDDDDRMEEILDDCGDGERLDSVMLVD